jgi:hypothetical protein
MATTSTVLRDLRKEIEDRIVGLTPNRMVKARATFKRYEAFEQKPITEFMGASRTFHLGNWEPQNDKWHFGYTQLAEIYHAPLTVVYARGIDWREAALDDVVLITDYLLKHPTAVSGVCHCAAIAGPLGIVSITPHTDPEQKWDYYTITLEAYLSVTSS